MPGSKEPEYAITLADAEARAAANPTTFEIPPAEARQALRVGDFAKVIFACVPALPTGQNAERMWLEVMEVETSGRYFGRLDNDPSTHPFTRYQCDDNFWFEARHVIEILSRLEMRSDTALIDG